MEILWSYQNGRNTIKNNTVRITWPSKSRGRILGQNPDKNLKSFLPYYLQSPLQLCFEIFFFKLAQPITVSTVQLLYTVEEKGGKPDRKPYPLPYGLRNPYRNLKP